AAASTERLRTALGRSGLSQGPDVSFDMLLANAQTALDRESELRRLRAELDERRRDVALRERAAEKAEAGEGAWAEAWSTTCRSCWLADTAEVPAIGVVREILV